MQETNAVISKEELHKNFLIIQKFLYPDERIKVWVAEDIDYHGGYHEYWEQLMEIIERISIIKCMSIWETLQYLVKPHTGYNGSDSDLTNGFDSSIDLYRICVQEIKVIVSTSE